MSQNRLGLERTRKACIRLPMGADDELDDFGHTAMRRSSFALWTSLSVLTDAGIGSGQRLARKLNCFRPVKTRHGWRT